MCKRSKSYFDPGAFLIFYSGFLFLNMHRKPKRRQVGNKTKKLTHTPFLSCKLHDSKTVISKRQRLDVFQCVDHSYVYTPILLLHAVLAGHRFESRWGWEENKCRLLLCVEEKEENTGNWIFKTWFTILASSTWDKMAQITYFICKVGVIIATSQDFFKAQRR